MKIRNRKLRMWNIAATVITVLMLLSAGGRVKEYFLHAQSESAPAATSVAQSSEPGAAKAESKPAEANTKKSEGEEPEGPNHELYTWINFLVLAGALWYLLKKLLAPYLKERGEAIREEMKQSGRVLEDANKRLATIEQKLQRLSDEIGSLRNSALAEAEAERGRIEERSKADARKIAQAAEQEIAAAAKVARQELKVYAAELAIGVAEKKIRESISAESEAVIFRSYLDDLKEGDAKRGPGTQRKGDA